MHYVCLSLKHLMMIMLFILLLQKPKELCCIYIQVGTNKKLRARGAGEGENVGHVLKDTTMQGVLWSCGAGASGQLGLGDCRDRLWPSRVRSQFCGSHSNIQGNSQGNISPRFLAAAAGDRHSVAVTEHGALHITRTLSSGRMGSGLHRLLLGGARVGRYTHLPQEHALAFACGTHGRLGAGAAAAARSGGSADQRRSRRLQVKSNAAADNAKAKGFRDSRPCWILSLPGELVRRVVEAFMLRPEGVVAGSLPEGVARLVGGVCLDQS